MFDRANGKIYEGYWKAGKKEGKGKLVLPSGEIIEGDWHNDAPAENNEENNNN